MPTAKLTSKGQVTIPKAVRETLGVDTGDRLEFKISASGRITVRADRPRPVSRIVGLLSAYRKAEPVTVEEMEAAIAEETASRLQRSRGR